MFFCHGMSWITASYFQGKSQDGVSPVREHSISWEGVVCYSPSPYAEVCLELELLEILREIAATALLSSSYFGIPSWPGPDCIIHFSWKTTEILLKCGDTP